MSLTSEIHSCRLLPPLLQFLLASSSYLQVALLKILRLLGKGHAQACELMSDVLAAVCHHLLLSSALLHLFIILISGYHQH